jgi:hypothetical protein
MWVPLHRKGLSDASQEESKQINSKANYSHWTLFFDVVPKKNRE